LELTDLNMTVHAFYYYNLAFILIILFQSFLMNCEQFYLHNIIAFDALTLLVGRLACKNWSN